jgi:T4 RnlA family RNA ligase
MYLLELIKDNPFEKVKETVTNPPYNLVVNEDAELPLYLLKYHQIDSDMGNPVVQECRGIILEKGTNKVVCFPFTKFFNAQEQHAHTVDYNSAKVLEKMDGSLIKWYFYHGSWRIATNGTIQAVNAPHPLKGNFLELVRESYDDLKLHWNRLDKDVTYMFELCHPLNKIVIRYDKPALYYLGSRNNKTFQEFYENPAPEIFPEPKTFSFNSLEDALEMSKELPFDQEGYIVVDKDYNRVKLKSPAYFAAHRMLGNGNVTPKRLIEMIRLGKIDDFSGMFPEYNELIDKVKSKMVKFKQLVIKQRKELDNKGYDTKKDFALMAVKTFYPSFMFRTYGIDNWKDNVDEMLNDINIEKLADLLDNISKYG